MWTDVSEEDIASIFKVENQPSKNQRVASVHILTTRRYIPEHGNIYKFSILSAQVLLC
jgi:hypothetical protein